jgi:DNA-binding beta-propeller fold protein YncE
MLTNRIRTRVLILGAALCLSTALSAVSAEGTDLYGPPALTKLHGVGNWDYITYDAVGRRLFVSRATRVMVIDPDTGSLITEIADTVGVHGIALAQDLGKGFTSNGRDNSVTVFDLKTLKTVIKLPLETKNPDGIVYDPVSRRIFTFNGGSASATAIDAVTNRIIGTVALDGRPEFAVADGKGMIFDNIEDKNEVAVIDARTLAVTHTFPISPCDGPSGMAMDRVHRRVFSVCSNGIMTVLDADSGKVVATPPIGAGSDAAAFDEATQRVFSSNGTDGTLTVLRETSANSYDVLQTARTQKYAKTMALGADASTVYLVSADITLGPIPAGGTRPTRTQIPDTFVLLTLRSAR